MSLDELFSCYFINWILSGPCSEAFALAIGSKVLGLSGCNNGYFGETYL